MAQKRNLTPISSYCPFYPLPVPAEAFCLSRFALLDIPYKWNPTTGGLLKFGLLGQNLQSPYLLNSWLSSDLWSGQS